MRPLGVTILSLIMLVGGVTFFASGLSLMFSKEIAYPLFKEEYSMLLNQSFYGVNISEETFLQIYDAVAYIAVFFGIIYALMGLGLFMMREWGRIGTVILAGFNVLYGIFLVFIQPIGALPALLNIIIIWYLMRPDVRDRFRRKLSIEDRILGNQK